MFADEVLLVRSTAVRRVRELRWWAGRTYTKLYHRAAPRSVRRVPQLPLEPLSRKFGADRGRPLDRVYIERFLATHAADVHGRVLEIYEPTYTRRFGGARVLRADVLDAAVDAPRATLRGDLETGEGLPEGVFDCFICTQTLSLVHDARAALGHARRALAPGGVLLATVPGVSHHHAGDEDFPDQWRFTAAGLRRLAADVFGADSVEVMASGNVAVAAAFLYGLAEHEVAPDLLHRDDPDYELIITLRARRGPTAGEARSLERRA
jgi:SAM-dependent methyltransferase